MIDRYLFRLVAVRALSTLTVLVIIYSLFDLADAGRRLAPSLGWATVLHAAALRLPTIAVQLMPAASLLGGALVLGALHRHAEIEALTSLGATPTTLGRPLLLFGLVATLGSLIVGEVIAAPLEKHADDLYRGQRASALTGHHRPMARWIRAGSWFVRQGPRTQIVALALSKTFHVTRRLEGQHHDLELRDVVEYREEAHETRRLVHARFAFPPLAQVKAVAQAERGRAESHGIRELQARRHLIRASGHSSPLDELLVHLRLAFPALNLAGALILWALLLGPARGAALYAAAVTWVALLWIGTAGGFLLAQGGLLSPVIGTWGALCLILCGAGISLARAWPRRA